IALWNNPAFQVEMTALGLARADLVEAGQLRNPSLTLIFPFSTRILESVANWPFEALWQRPRRVAAAKLELERVGESLVSRALDLVRDALASPPRPRANAARSPRSSTPDFAPATSANWRRAPLVSTRNWPKNKRH